MQLGNRLLQVRVKNVSQADFRTFIASSEKVIVQYCRYPGNSFLPDVLHYFSTEYKNKILFGSVDKSKILFPGWFMKHVGSIFNSQLIPPKEAPNGYYLFISGKAVAFHSGKTKNDGGDFGVLAAGLIISLFDDSTKPLTASLDVLKQKTAKGVIALFEQAISNQPSLLEGNTATSDKKSDDKIIDPYLLLEISPFASIAEIKTAHKKQMRLNHSDFVARMSNEIQEFAEERTKKIQNAFETIMKQRQRKLFQ